MDGFGFFKRQRLYIYRSTSSTPITGNHVNTNLVVTTSYDDLTPIDTTYYYCITAVSATGIESTLSSPASALSDSTPPAASIQYTPHGRYDSVTGRMAPGSVDVTVTVSEPLMAAPFLSITPNVGLPVTVDLTQNPQIATQYTGTFVIAQSMPSGTATAVYSARDLVGNRGTTITSGETILLATHGPQVTSIAVTPATPIKIVYQTLQPSRL